MTMFFNAVRFFDNAKWPLMLLSYFKRFFIYTLALVALLFWMYMAYNIHTNLVKQNAMLTSKIISNEQEIEGLKKSIFLLTQSNKISNDSVVKVEVAKVQIEEKQIIRVNVVKEKVKKIKEEINLPIEEKTNEISKIYITDLNSIYTELNEEIGANNET